jgi:hypothetical protein
MASSTTIKVSRDTKERIRQRGEKGDTYEDIIEELLDTVEEMEEAEA